MSSREIIMQKLQGALSPGHLNQSIMPAVENRPGNLDTFVEKVTAAAGQVTRTKEADVPAAIKAILEEAGCKSLILSDEVIVKELGIKDIADAMGIDCQYASTIPAAEYRSKLFQTAASITGCDYALADSGTVVIKHRSENQRLVSLAPNLYICMVKAAQMLKDRQDLAAILEKEGRPAAVTLITGVSRTADVALQVVLGMHGPRKVNIVLIED